MVPRISVIMPCYNHGQFIRDAIASVETSPAELWELIIVNDGSTDDETLRVLDDLRTKGYRIIDQENSGPAAARNTGIATAAGEYILPLDSDNRIRPTYMEKGIAVLDKHPEIGVVYADAEFWGEREGIWKGREFDLFDLLEGNYIDNCSVYRKTIWVQLDGYDTKIPGHGVEDWEFWLGAAEKGWKFHYVPEVLFDYCVRGGSVIRTLHKDGYEEAAAYVTEKHSLWMFEEFRLRYPERRTAELTLEPNLIRTYLMRRNRLLWMRENLAYVDLLRASPGILKEFAWHCMNRLGLIRENHPLVTKKHSSVFLRATFDSFWAGIESGTAESKAR